MRPSFRVSASVEPTELADSATCQRLQVHGIVWFADQIDEIRKQKYHVPSRVNKKNYCKRKYT
jgi:hypothetical protein